MALKAASDRLVFADVKTRDKMVHAKTVEVRLASGDVSSVSPVSWTAKSSASWLVLTQTSGTVSSASPVADLHVTMSAAGHADTSESGQPLIAFLTVESRLQARTDLFQNSTDRIEMQVEFEIKAEPYLGESDVSVRTSSMDMVAVNSEVIAGDTLEVTVNVLDCERMPISRPGLQIVLSLTGGKRTDPVPLGHRGNNVYDADMPNSWIEDAGSYTLWVNSTNSAVRVDFQATKANTKAYVGLGIGGMILLTVLIAVYLLHKNRDHAKEFLLTFASQEGLLVYLVRFPQPHSTYRVALERSPPLPA